MKAFWVLVTAALVIGAFAIPGTLGLVSGVLALGALAGYYFNARQTKSLLKSGAKWYVSNPKRRQKAKKWINKSSD